MSSHRVSTDGVEFIAGEEGFINGAYNDSRGFATAGYGHLLHQSPATAADHRAYDGKGRAFYLQLLHADIDRVAIQPMNHYLTRDLNQNQDDAVASGCFNCGGGFVAGTIGRLINAGRLNEAAEAFKMWAHPAVLMGRRLREIAMFRRAPKKAMRLPWLRGVEREWVFEYDHLKRTHTGLDRRRVLRRFMHAKCLEIEHAAVHEGGWDRKNRRLRHHSLAARCE